MNKTQLAERIGAKINISDITVLRFLDAMESVITEQVAKGDTVLITGFVKFEPVDKPAHEARNPKNGETIQVSARRTVKIRPMATLKRDVAGS